MEILDAGPEGEDLPGRTTREPVEAELVADLDADRAARLPGTAPAGRPAGSATGSADGGARTAPEGSGEAPADPGSGARRVLADVLTPEALGLASLVLTIVALTGGFQVVLLLNGGGLGADSPRTFTEQYAQGLALFAVPSFLLAVSGGFRLRPDRPRWVGAVSGAALILATLALLLAGFALWHASDLSSTNPQGVVSG